MLQVLAPPSNPSSWPQSDDIFACFCVPVVLREKIVPYYTKETCIDSSYVGVILGSWYLEALPEKVCASAKMSSISMPVWVACKQLLPTSWWVWPRNVQFL